MINESQPFFSFISTLPILIFFFLTMSEATSLVSILMKQLNNSNYPEWAIRMEAILVQESLWSLVNPTSEEKDNCTQEKMECT